MMAACAAGIDAGKCYLDVGIEPSGHRFRVRNAAAGIGGLIERLQREGVRRVILEAIGPYARTVVAALAEAGFEVGLVNPRRIKGFREAEGKRAKTDKLDAGLIARFALRMAETVRPLPSENQIALKSLTTRRRQLVEFVAMEKTRLKQATDALIVMAVLSQRYDILVSLPGFGSAVATTLITDLPELGTIDRRAIASLAGLAPHPTQSGNSPGRNQIAGGRPCVRTALYMAGLVACRCDPRFRANYLAIRADGKPAKLAIVAVARKLLVLANTLVKNGRSYDPTHIMPSNLS